MELSIELWVNCTCGERMEPIDTKTTGESITNNFRCPACGNYVDVGYEVSGVLERKQHRNSLGFAEILDVMEAMVIKTFDD